MDDVNIKLDSDQIDTIVIHELKSDYRISAKYPDENPELLKALDLVLDYYLSNEEKVKWKQEKVKYLNDTRSIETTSNL